MNFGGWDNNKIKLRAIITYLYEASDAPLPTCPVDGDDAESGGGRDMAPAEEESEEGLLLKFFRNEALLFIRDSASLAAEWQAAATKLPQFEAVLHEEADKARIELPWFGSLGWAFFATPIYARLYLLAQGSIICWS